MKVNIWVFEGLVLQERVRVKFRCIRISISIVDVKVKIRGCVRKVRIEKKKKK